MAQEAAPQGRERVRAEDERSLLVPLPADARLRSWLVHGYGGFDGASLPHGPVLVPATLATPLVVDVSGLAWRPPVIVMGPGGTYTRVEGPCASAILVRLAPLGAYKLLGPAVSEIGGSIVGLEDVVGADARRLSEQVRSARTWQARGRLLDDFLLDRAADGPQPSPEVRQAWHLLVRSGGRSTIKGIARQVGWSHKLREFRRFTGTTPGALVTR